MIILEENFKWHLEGFASELIYLYLEIKVLISRRYRPLLWKYIEKIMKTW